MNEITIIQKEIAKELSNKEVVTTLLQTTFKGLSEGHVKPAIVEGHLRGFTFKDFLEKNVYAIPFKGGYSLVTSIDYARKIGMRSGVVGVSKPDYQETAEGGIISCTITVKRKVQDYVGEYSATVYFSEYNTGFNLWKTKPRTMIAKVAEMHALRMACPEELSQMYTEEEYQKETKEMPEVDTTQYQTRLEECKNIEELKTAWASLPQEAKAKLEEVKNKMKAQYENA